jgi:hypothetical protein
MMEMRKQPIIQKGSPKPWMPLFFRRKITIAISATSVYATSVYVTSGNVPSTEREEQLLEKRHGFL